MKSKQTGVTQLEEAKWTTCCSGTTEKSFVKYLVQVIMGATIIIFSMVQIWRDTGEGKEIYFSLLSGTLGVFWPHPQIGANSTTTNFGVPKSISTRVRRLDDTVVITAPEVKEG